METQLSLANEILAQLGGRKFLVMTGAKNLLALENGLQFRLPSAPHFVKDGINCVQIILDPADTYTVKFMKIRGAKVTTVKECDDIYNDMLQSVFTCHTGLDTHL